jgi:hypothetical protein
LHYLSSLNRRKILSKNAFAFLFALLTALSLYNLSSVIDGYLNEGRFEIADGTEYRLLYAEESLTGSKVSETAEEYGELDLPLDIGRVAAGDVRLVRMIAQVYGWGLDVPAPDELSDERFYADREAILLAGLGRTSVFAAPAYPLELGCAEGWKNINAGMGNCLRIVMLIVFLALVPVYNEDRTLGVDNLIRSTKSGKEKLARVRVVNALQLSALIYAAAASLYVIPLAIMYGLAGAALPIQGDYLYFMSPVGLSYLGQFAVNLLIGAIAVAGMAGIALLISAVIADVFTGYAALMFITAISYLIDVFELTGFKHFLWNFSPVGAVDLNAYYVGHETYFSVPSIIFVPLVSLMVICGELLLLFVLTQKEKKFKIKYTTNRRVRHSVS